jgi:hypothetical protein
VALDVADLEETEGGFKIIIRRSKADQEGHGVTIAIARGVTACPRQGCRGVAAGDNYKAASLENAARRGRVAAVQIGASASEKIFSDLANIDAVGAAAHTDPTSPAGAAVARLA